MQLLPVAITIGYYFDQCDYIPILLLMASVAALEADRPLRSALCCALGALAKIFPAVVLPVAILSFGRLWRMQYLLVFAALVLAVTVTWLVAAPESLQSFLHFVVARPSWETIIPDGRHRRGMTPAGASFRAGGTNTRHLR